MKEKYKCIYSLKLAGYLMMHGYPIRSIDKNKYNPKWDVYFFDDTDEIKETIEFYNYRKSKENNYGINNRSSRGQTDIK